MRSFLSVVCVIAIAGCGGSHGTLSGKVTFKGKPVASGTVIALASDGIPRYGKIETDGSYTIPEVPAGEAKIGVNSPNPAVDPKKIEAAKNAPKRGGRQQSDPITGPTSDPALWFPIPGKVGDPNSSDLKTTVNNGANSFNIDLN